jgi:hypothetical protein
LRLHQCGVDLPYYSWRNGDNRVLTFFFHRKLRLVVVTAGTENKYQKREQVVVPQNKSWVYYKDNIAERLFE